MRKSNLEPKSQSERMRDDVYLVVCIVAGIGLVASAYEFSAWPFIISLIVCVGLWGLLIGTQIMHERELEKAREAGRVEVRKIIATKRPSDNAIVGTARVVQLPPNYMPPSPQPELAFRKLIENETTRMLPPKYWTYTLPDGTQARGDLITAIANGAFDEDRDKDLEFRDYVRAQYHVEFSNRSYGDAIKALRYAGAIDKEGRWIIDHEQVTDLLGRMVNAVVES